MWVPIWKHLARLFPTPTELWRKMRRRQPAEPTEQSNASNASNAASTPEGTSEKPEGSSLWVPTLFLGSAMVARGEIGLLIIEIGYNTTPYVSKEGFITGVWAILLNTIIGPITVGLLVKFHGNKLGKGEWGLQQPILPGREEGPQHEAV